MSITNSALTLTQMNSFNLFQDNQKNVEPCASLFKEIEQLETLGSNLSEKGKNIEAIDHFTKALAIYRKIFSGSTSHLNVSTCHLKMRNAIYNEQRYQEALDAYTMSLTIRKEIYGYQHLLVAEALQQRPGLYTIFKKKKRPLPI